jgi:long-chain acyl-CoA synthetase
MDEKPWLAHYDPGVPTSLHPYPPKTLCAVVAEAAHDRPDYPAILFKGARMSWQQLYRQSVSLAASLQAAGVVPGDRVTLLLPNCPQFVVCQLGAWQAGAIVVPLNPLYTEDELLYALNISGATTAIVLSPFYHKLKALQPRTPLQRIIVTNIKECLPWPKRLAFTVLKEKQEGHRVTLAPEDLWLNELLHHPQATAAPPVIPGPADPALLMFTGGTTGRSKAALSTHGGLLAAAMQIRAWLGDTCADWEDRILLLLPMFHTYGNIAALGSALIAHLPMIPIPNPRDLDDLVATIDKTRPAFLTGVPTLFIALLNHPAVRAGQANFRSLKLCLSGAAPLLLETKTRFEALTGGRILEGYALTESVMATVMTPVNGVYKPGSVGLPLPDVEVRIVAPEDEAQELPLGEVGHILMHAPQIMQGYWNDPEQTAETLHDGWLLTGDLGYLDSDGYLFLVDRLKDLIKVSGYQVWPREVEEALATHPAVNEVGVAGVPDPLRGEVVKAWIVLQGDDRPSEADLRAYCREHLAPYKVPRKIEFCDSLPKSAVGKVLRRKLGETERQEVRVASPAVR